MLGERLSSFLWQVTLLASSWVSSVMSPDWSSAPIFSQCLLWFCFVAKVLNFRVTYFLLRHNKQRGALIIIPRQWLLTVVGWVATNFKWKLVDFYVPWIFAGGEGWRKHSAANSNSENVKFAVKRLPLHCHIYQVFLKTCDKRCFERKLGQSLEISFED